MSYLILIRHGQSTWNLEGRFTGWVDVDLTENGKLEAKKAAELIKKLDIKINYYYSSLQLRANNTLKIIQKILNDNQNFIRAWELNERHYGMLTGLNKVEMSKKIGKEKYLSSFLIILVFFNIIKLGVSNIIPFLQSNGPGADIPKHKI